MLSELHAHSRNTHTNTHRHLRASVGHQEMKGSFSLEGDERIEEKKRWRKKRSVCSLMQIPATDTVWFTEKKTQQMRGKPPPELCFSFLTLCLCEDWCFTHIDTLSEHTHTHTVTSFPAVVHENPKIKRLEGREFQRVKYNKFSRDFLEHGTT